MLRITQIKLKCDEPVSMLPSRIARTLKIKDFRPASWHIVKESIDARKKPDISFIYTVDFEVADEERLLLKASRMKGVNLARVTEKKYELPQVKRKNPQASELADAARPVVVGFGPCGMFAALILAEAGLCPIVLERGRDVDRRTRDVEHFWQTGELDCRSNVQYGEGGAGTFSDGKLTTGIKDVRISKVNEEFIAAGADPSIAYKQMPHIGTDVLRTVVKNIREKIIALGGEVRFESQVTGIITEENGGSRNITAIKIEGSQTLAVGNVIFALGNSARDTFRMLKAAGVAMEAKPFSVGVRIEHPQVVINEAQYGEAANDSEGRLGAATYKLSHHCANGRGVYTFCMCPGGVVVGAASEENGVVTNGMSYFARDGVNANSALLVGVEPADYMSYGDGEDDPLAGVAFQESLERKAYELGGGGYIAPAERLGDFLEKKMPPKDCKWTVEPTYRPGVVPGDINRCLPDFITDAMREATGHMSAKLKNFDMEDAVITGVETRSSSPLRILRDARGYESTSISGLYPAGEGAGYAGGIMSAAVDGIRVAEKVIEGGTASRQHGGARGLRDRGPVTHDEKRKHHIRR